MNYKIYLDERNILGNIPVKDDKGDEIWSFPSDWPITRMKFVSDMLFSQRHIGESIAAKSLRQASLVPGMLHCIKCKFVCNKINLNINTGTVTSGSNDSEPCPNGCGPLWQVSWREYADDLLKQSEKDFNKIEALKEQLEEANARLETIDKLEPVAWIIGAGSKTVTTNKNDLSLADRFNWAVTKLYAIPTKEISNDQ